jgi:hypothetical protein
MVEALYGSRFIWGLRRQFDLHKHLASVRREVISCNRYEILPLILGSWDALCTDSRDKIYSMLGLAQEIFDGHPVDLARN